MLATMPGLLPAFIAIALLGFLLLHSYSKPKQRYPPGPKGLPIIGSLLEIDNERPWITYDKWIKEYGDIVMFWVLGKPTLLLGSMNHSVALLQKRMMNYGDRPELVVAQEFIAQNGWYLGTSRIKYNMHKKHRKLLGERLRAAALQDWAHPALLPEMHLLLQRLTTHPDRFVSIIKCFTVNVMLGSTFGYRSISSLDDPLIGRINTATDHQFAAQIHGRYWVDYIPFLKHLPVWVPGMSWKKRALQYREEVYTLYGELWDSTKKQIAEHKTERPCLVQNLLETQMNEIEPLEGITITTTIVDGGTDTLTGTTVTIILIFLYFPHVLKKAQDIVDQAIGRDRLPNFNDLPRLPYITALVREAFRWRTVAPVANPHSVVEDDVYTGYFIPKGTTVFPFSQHIHENEELYPHPEDFRPERFLDDKGQLNNLPHAGFGFGSRKCVGMHFAEQALFLAVSNLVWAFDMTAPIDENGQKILPSLDPKDWGAFLASPPPMDFKAVITPREQATVDVIGQTIELDRR